MFILQLKAFLHHYPEALKGYPRAKGSPRQPHNLKGVGRKLSYFKVNASVPNPDYSDIKLHNRRLPS